MPVEVEVAFLGTEAVPLDFGSVLLLVEDEEVELMAVRRYYWLEWLLR